MALRSRSCRFLGAGATSAALVATLAFGTTAAFDAPPAFAAPPATSKATPAASASPAITAPAFALERYRLDNGLEVMIHEDHRTPIVAVNLWYHVGSKDESPGKNGFAHLFEHMMFQGSRHVGEDMFFKYLEKAGTSERNGTTNTDRTNYFEAVPANQLELVLWLESDRMAFLLDHADQATFEGQRNVVKNERRQNYENAPYGLVWQFLQAAVYPKDHPYHLLTIGTPEDLDAASLEDVKAFFRTFYVPNNATLVVGGDLDKTRAKELVAQYFAPIVPSPGMKPPPVHSKAMPVTLTGEKILRVEANVELPRVVVTWPTPAALTADDMTLDVLSQVLSHGKTSRLYKRLVHELQIAQDVHASQSSSQLGSEFDITVTVQKGKTPEQALAEIDAELAKVRAQAPTAAEIERARTTLASGLVFRSERLTSRIDQLNYFNQYVGRPDFLGDVLAHYQSVTGEAVQKAASTHLPRDRRVVAIVTPNPSAPRAGRLVGGTTP